MAEILLKGGEVFRGRGATGGGDAVLDSDLRVERGPDWLFVRLDGDPSKERHSRGSLSDTVWRMLRESLAHRLVLELESVESVDQQLLDEISRLGRRVRAEGGVIRLCGLSDDNLARLRSSPVSEQVPHFRCRTDAVRACRSSVS